MSADPDPSMPSYEILVQELKKLRLSGLPSLRERQPPALAAAAVAAGYCEGPDDVAAGIERLLHDAARLHGEEDPVTRTIVVLFGLAEGLRGKTGAERRTLAAEQSFLSEERFRRKPEFTAITQLAASVMDLVRRKQQRDRMKTKAAAHPAAVPRVGGPARPEEAFADDDLRHRVLVHVQPIQLLRDIDILVSSENVYLEVSRTFGSSISSALRNAAAVRGPGGEITDDVVRRELEEWMLKHSRRGLSVRPGTVVATSPGALASHGVRRIYHAAVAVPVNDAYAVRPEDVAHAVSGVFSLARDEREHVDPDLASICFPLLGAGSGGLTPNDSAAWLRWAIRDELDRDPTWQVHLVTRRRAVAEAIRWPGGSKPGADTEP